MSGCGTNHECLVRLQLKYCHLLSKGHCKPLLCIIHTKSENHVAYPGYAPCRCKPASGEKLCDLCSNPTHGVGQLTWSECQPQHFFLFTDCSFESRMKNGFYYLFYHIIHFVDSKRKIKPCPNICATQAQIDA